LLEKFIAFLVVVKVHLADVINNTKDNK